MIRSMSDFGSSGIKCNGEIRFSNIVGLFGKNGAGKTRLLNHIYENYNKKDTPILWIKYDEIISLSHNIDEEEQFYQSNYKYDTLTKFTSTQEVFDFVLKYPTSILEEYSIYKRDGSSEIEEWEEFARIFEGSLCKKVESRVSRNGPKNYGLNIRLNDFGFEYALLSEGERIFLILSLVYCIRKMSRITQESLIIMIDEIELRLHPELQVQVFSLLKVWTEEEVQLWFSSHSIHILPELEHSQIYIIENNKIIPPNINSDRKAIKELFGLEEYIERTQEFLFYRDVSQYYEFIEQCFHDASVFKIVKKNDPQVEIISNYTSKKIRMLDYGAGKGRLAREIGQKVLYSAYEPNKNYKEDLVRLKEEGLIKKIFNESNKIGNNYDCVLLCNVLHEIDPDDWIDTVELVYNCLSSHGIVLIIEDYQIPFGEKPNKHGYFLLSPEEIRRLFVAKGIKVIHSKQKKYEQRIMGIVIKKTDIRGTEISNGRKTRVLSLMKRRLEDAIYDIHFTKRPEDYNREYARLIQMHVNIYMYIKYLERN